MAEVKIAMTEQARRIAKGLSEAQRRDVLALGHPDNLYGGLFDALSADDHIEFKHLHIVRSYIPAGCYAPLTKLTPLGLAVRQHLLSREKQ